MSGPGILATPGACPICGAGAGAPCDPGTLGPILDGRHAVPVPVTPFLLLHRGWMRYLTSPGWDREDRFDRAGRDRHAIQPVLRESHAQRHGESVRRRRVLVRGVCCVRRARRQEERRER